MRRSLPNLLVALAAACSASPLTEPKFERPIRVEASPDGTLLVDGEVASWESLRDVLRGAVRSRGTEEGFRPSAVVRIRPGCEEGTSARLLDALVGAGVREIDFADRRG
ncbi:MAG: ExbD/TolR family protein [Planctomycetota bacterium]